MSKEKEFNLMNETGLDEFMSSLQEDIINSSKEQSMKMSYENDCPHCSKTVSLVVGKNICPFCQQEIELHLDFE